MERGWYMEKPGNNTAHLCAQGQPGGNGRGNNTAGDAWIWLQWSIESRGKTRQYTVITICSDSKKDIGRWRRDRQDVG